MQSEILVLIILTLLPFLELRASIPYGILNTDLGWFTVFLICVIANILLAPIVYFFLDKIVHLFFFIKPFERFYKRKVEKTQKKIHKYVEKYGEIGLALFIAVPLPGSGVYTGAIAAYVLGMSYKDFIKAAAIGVLIAGVIVTAISISGNEAFKFLI
ncbi:small multi-drug export protein [Candidatus Woesearchaeota archaeon]|nr:small multi-drug export protein [Candidatus Woesearchaeota archaeon]